MPSIAYARYQLKRSILDNALENDFSAEDHNDALEFFGGCAFCGDKEARRKDHLIPVIHWGGFTRCNVVPACQKCDDSKGRREYHDWMRNSNSRRSLKARGFTDEEIEERIKRIEKWQSGYRAKTEKELFGKEYAKYQEILQRMKRLCEEAEQMIQRVQTRNRKPRITQASMPRSSKSSESSADRIRQFIIKQYVVPASRRGEKTITVRAGDVHAKMKLRRQHANVCQVMKGDKFRHLANVKLKSFKGTSVGANAYFTYQL